MKHDPSLNMRRGEVIANGHWELDGKKRPFALVYNGSSNRATCPKDEIEILRAMGFHIEEHWADERMKAGHAAIRGFNFAHEFRPVTPRFIKLRNRKATNASMANLLEGEY